ncbi:MAG: FtsW/RodA/SpoVE family cell cycle protein [Clostridia bacterium]|jgi:cell division protein FtsW (lipid II flippase)|nr:FtsW/RodA/SpoVE family cell cycle protein [Clostridia bacterium]
MEIKDFLKIVCKQIKYIPAREEIKQELQEHMQEMKQEYINNGIQEKQAEQKVVLQMGKAEVIGKRLNKIHKPKLDWKLLILIVILIGYGLLVAILKTNVNYNYIKNNIIYIILGSFISIGIYFFDYRRIKKYDIITYIISSIIMIFPMFTINGIKHIRISNMSFIPSILTLQLYTIAFVGFISSYNENNKIFVNLKLIRKTISINKDLIKIMLCSMLSIILIIKSELISNAIILSIIYLVISTFKILQASKNQKRNLIIMYGSLAIFILIILFELFMSPFRFKRIISSFKPEIDPQGAGYIGILQKEVIENAQFIGVANTQIAHEDEIIINSEGNYTFIYLIEKTGIIVSGLLVCTIILTSIKLIYNAKRLKEIYGKFLIIGLSSLYIIQSVANILMNINLGIQININLPFVTYGGAYFIVNIINIAIILSIYRRKDINFYDNQVILNKI